MKRKLLLLTLPALLLVACSNGDDSSAGDTSVEPTTSETSNESSEIATSEETSWPSNIAKDITYGDSLIDLMIDRSLCVGVEYKLSFAYTESELAGSTVTLADSSYGEITGSDGTFYLTPTKSGQTVLYIRDATNYIHLRRVITIKDPIEAADMDDHLLRVDHYQSVILAGFNMTMTFIGDGMCILAGSDEGTDIGSITFSYAYSSTWGDDEYKYAISDFENNYSTLAPTCFTVNMTGDMIHLIKEYSDGSIITYGIFLEAEA